MIAPRLTLPCDRIRGGEEGDGGHGIRELAAFDLAPPAVPGVRLLPASRAGDLASLQTAALYPKPDVMSQLGAVVGAAAESVRHTSSSLRAPRAGTARRGEALYGAAPDSGANRPGRLRPRALVFVRNAPGPRIAAISNT